MPFQEKFFLSFSFCVSAPESFFNSLFKIYYFFKKKYFTKIKYSRLLGNKFNNNIGSSDRFIQLVYFPVSILFIQNEIPVDYLLLSWLFIYKLIPYQLSIFNFQLVLRFYFYLIQTTRDCGKRIPTVICFINKKCVHLLK